MKLRNQFRQQFAKTPTVACVAINRPSFIAARGDMIPTARPLDAQGSGHEHDRRVPSFQDQMLSVKM